VLLNLETTTIKTLEEKILKVIKIQFYVPVLKLPVINIQYGTDTGIKRT
jgi:hypothetical protein